MKNRPVPTKQWGQVDWLNSRLLVSVMLILVHTPLVVGESTEITEPDDFLDMSLEELMEIEMITASRQPQKLGEVSAPVSVITAEDIHQSGLTSIPEILQFTPGMDFVRFDRNRVAVGVRGLHGVFSDRTLVLINGRQANNAMWGGVEWSRLPVLLEDIERIEIVRGPGSAAWGANAYTGVINIITKSPEDIQGVFGSTTFSEFNDTYSHLRYAGQKDAWSFRLSGGYEEIKSSDDVLGDAPYTIKNTQLQLLLSSALPSYTARDFSHNWRFDTEASYQASESTRFSLGTGYDHQIAGDFELVGYFPMENTHNEFLRPFARVDHDFENGHSGFLQWYGNFAVTHAPQLQERYGTYENVLEGQFDLQTYERHTVSLGANLRTTEITMQNGSNVQETTYAGGNFFEEQWIGFFVIDRYQATDKLDLEAQLRADYYSESHWDWSTRLAAIYALDAKRDHKLRLSGGKAFRAPSVGIREGQQSRLLNPLLSDYMVNTVAAPDDIRNEETYSLELGYIGKIAQGWTLTVDGYYQRMENLIGAKSITGPNPFLQYRQLDNFDGADTFGAECQLSWEQKTRKLSLFYAYNYFEEDQHNQKVRAYWPTRHKLGFNLRQQLPWGLVFNANLSSRSILWTNDISRRRPSAHSYDRLDLTLSKRLFGKHGEVMVGVQDALEARHDSVSDVGSLTAHDLSGRMFFGRAQIQF